MRNTLWAVLALIVGGGCLTNRETQESAERNAQEFAEDLNLDWVGVSCTSKRGLSGAKCECSTDVYFDGWVGQERGCELIPFARGFSPD